jgi:hypothetical protein
VQAKRISRSFVIRRRVRSRKYKTYEANSGPVEADSASTDELLIGLPSGVNAFADGGIIPQKRNRGIGDCEFRGSSRTTIY